MIVLLLVILLAPVPAGAAVPDPVPWGSTAPAAIPAVGTWPLRPEPVVVRPFDPPATPWGAGHRGVDLLATPGQVVRSALPGTVAYAGVLAGRGVVVVSHGSTRTTYEPVAATAEVGTVVVAGDRLGTVQAVPSHCAPRTCLHWGWVAGETYLDPLRLVGQGPVRLLPLTAPEPPRSPLPSTPWLPVPVAAREVPAGPPVPAWW